MTIDSSTSLSPSSTTASTGTFDPGPHEQQVTDHEVRGGDLDGLAVAQHHGLGRGQIDRSVRMASLAPPRARISNQCPRSTKAASTVAAS